MLALTVILVLIGGLYLRTRLISTWRAIAFCLGLLSIWIASASPLASLDGRMLTAHMAQHLLLMTIGPPLIWLGEPLKGFDARPIRRLGAVLGHPVVGWLSSITVLVLWHVPALLQLAMQSPTWHLVEHASFLSTGLLFWWPVIQPWPSEARWSGWSILLYLFFATLPCDVMAALLVFSDRVAYPVYLCTAHAGGLTVLEDQQSAGALMWTCVTVVYLVAGTILATKLLSPPHSV